jgi:hypothetical protein
MTLAFSHSNVNKMYYISDLLLVHSYAVKQLVEALRYQPEDRGFDSR